jgi:hypothetical protein
MESTVVEVLILNGLEEGSFYKILVEFQRPRGGDA